MAFKEEVSVCIRQYDSSAEAVSGTFLSELACNAIYIPGKNLVFHLIPIPFAGLQDLTPDYFQKKSLEYSAQGIQLVHLWQDHWVRKQEIVRSRIAALLGSGARIHARQTTVRRISKDGMRVFFEANHLQGAVNARYTYGLFVNEQLVAAASFSAGRNVVRNGIACRSFEMLRYASLLNHRVVGGIGKLIAHFAEELHPGDIMTYADLDWASGKGYRALHFRQTAVTPPQMFWIHPAEMTRYYLHRLPPQLTEAFERCNNQVTIIDFLTDKGYLKIYNAGNLKYLLTCGN